jgi:putative hydrolase of the HAD superfamily
MPIKTVIVDIGGVVLLENPEFWQRLQQEYNAPSNVEALFYGPESPWADCRTGRLDERQYTEIVAQRLEMNVNDLMSLRQSLEWTVNPFMVDWLKQCRHSGLEVIALSNADFSLEERLRGFGVIELFDQVLNSARLGVAKPDPAIYEVALAKSNSPAYQCLFIDDRPKNLEAASLFGLKTLLYESVEQFALEADRLFKSAEQGF